MTMLEEARSIPDIAARSLARNAPAFREAARRISAFAPQVLVTVARGSSDSASEWIARLFAARLGMIPASLPPSLITVQNAQLNWRGALIMAVSQSGRSPDLIVPVEVARAAGALTVAIVNDAESPLAAAAELVIPVDAGAELAIAATKSFLMTLFQGARLLAAIQRDASLEQGLAGLPANLAQALATSWTPAVEVLRDATAPFVVGRGLMNGIARELALKLKEVCGLHAEAISGAEVMHGPKALIHEHHPVLAFTPMDDSRAAMESTVEQLGALSRRVVAVGAAIPGARIAVPIDTPSRADLSGLVIGTAVYPFIAELAAARGLSPDAPKNIQKVTKTL